MHSLYFQKEYDAWKSLRATNREQAIVNTENLVKTLSPEAKDLYEKIKV